MLKLCCECIAGGTQMRDPVSPEASYGSTRLPRNSYTAPQWPTPSVINETMFILPKPLRSGDGISITGKLTNDPKIFIASLITGETAPDYNNVACQMQALFPSPFMIKTIQDGQESVIDGEYQEYEVTENLPDSEFNVKFIVMEGNSLLVKVGFIELQFFRLRHNLNEIKFISLSGDITNVSTLEFQFGK